MTVAEELEKSPILRTGICLANLQESHSNAGLHCVMRDSSSIDDHSSKQLFTANSKFPSFLSYLLRTSTNKIHLFGSRQTPFPFFLFPQHCNSSSFQFLLDSILSHRCRDVLIVPDPDITLCLYSQLPSPNFLFVLVPSLASCLYSQLPAPNFLSVLVPCITCCLGSPTPNSLCLGDCRLLYSLSIGISLFFYCKFLGFFCFFNSEIFDFFFMFFLGFCCALLALYDLF